MVGDMTDAELGSRSDLEALARSGRGKVVVLALMLVVALGAAGWLFFGRKQGVGNKEDSGKVIVVARTRGYSTVLDDVGFEAAEGTFEAWEQKAKEEVPELDVEGLPAIMAVADRFGYGYVVFENPQDIEGWDALDIDDGMPALPEHVKFAVLSVGDFAFPHVVTVNPKPSAVMRGSSVVLLQALFEQEQLHELLPDNESPSMDAIQRRDRLRDALDRLADIPEAEKMAEKIINQVRRQLVDEERAEPKPSLVGEALESGSPFALANGQVLTVSRSFEVISRDAVRADLHLDDMERLLIGAPGAEASSRTRCDAVFGGEISVHESPAYEMGHDGAALLVKTLGEGSTLWTLEPGKPGCGLAKRGKVPAASPGLGDAVPAGHGQVARVGMVGSQGVIAVVTAGQDDERMLGMLDDVRLSSVTWLSARHLAAVGKGPDGTGLYLFDTQTPLTVLYLPSTLFENAEVMHQVAAGRRGDTPIIVVTAGISPRRAYRLDLPSGLESLFTAPVVGSDSTAAVDGEPVDEALADDELPSREARGLPVVVPLDANRFVSTALTHEGSARNLTVSADGTTVAFALRGEAFDPAEPGDSEIGVVPSKGGTMRVLTRNGMRDHHPQLTPNGSHVMFQTRVEIPRTEWVVTSPRIVAVGG